MTRRRPARHSIWALVIPGILACGDSATSGHEAGVRDSAGIRIVENPSTEGDTCVAAPEPDLEIGLVEGPSEYQFYRVFDAATLSDGRIAVVNQGSGQIRVYFPDGTFDRAFGGQGGGPGEFRDVFQLWVMPGDTILVGDYRPWRFSVFTPEGEFVRAIVPEPRYINPPESSVPLSDGTFVISQNCCPFRGEEGEWQERWLHLVHHAWDGSLIDTLAVLPHGRHGWLDFEIRFGGTPLFESTSRVAGRGDRVLIGRGRERELEVYEMTTGTATETTRETAPIDASRPTALIRWTGPDRTITREDLEAYRRAELERYADADPRFQQAAEALVSPDRPVADRFPAHASIRIGLEGDIWVHEYPRPLEEDPGWLVFDSEGRFQCRVWLPFAEAWDIYEIGPDYVLGKVEDEFDVEHVRRYSLTRPDAR